jgi:hypothetical protein
MAGVKHNFSVAFFIVQGLMGANLEFQRASLERRHRRRFSYRWPQAHKKRAESERMQTLLFQFRGTASILTRTSLERRSELAR